MPNYENLAGIRAKKVYAILHIFKTFFNTCHFLLLIIHLSLKYCPRRTNESVNLNPYFYLSNFPIANNAIEQIKCPNYEQLTYGQSIEGVLGIRTWGCNIRVMEGADESIELWAIIRPFKLSTLSSSFLHTYRNLIK